MVGTFFAHLRQQWMGALALFLVLSGGSAFALAGHNTVFSDDVVNNQLKSADLKNGKAVSGIDVKNGSLGTAEFAGSIPAVHATRSASQIIPDGSTFTAIAFDEERYDTASMHSNLIIANNSRLTAPVDGIYELTAAILWGTSDEGTRAMALRRNGTTLLAHENVPAAGGGLQPEQLLTATVRLEAGDYGEVVVAQTSGGFLGVTTPEGQLSPEFSMTWLAPG
jgi:hypothetical protein